MGEQLTGNKSARALVVGAGVAGIRAALDLAETGYHVLLVESSPAIGGLLAKLDNQFGSNHCGMCQMLPAVTRDEASLHCLRRSLFHERIEILPLVSVEAVQGEAGAFTVALRERARFVDTDACLCNGRCVEVCPVSVPDAFNEKLAERKAIYRPVPHNLPNTYCIDMDSCTRCGECVKACPASCIDLDAVERTFSVDVDAIIFATGSGLLEAGTDPEASRYLVSPNVVTSVGFERLLTLAGGPRGALKRPSDGKRAERIAWLQCVGSRDPAHGRDYCSSACCMIALKEAILAKQWGGPETETAVFYMDMRTFGKGYHRYRREAEETHGVRLVRSRLHDLQEMADGSVRLRYVDQTTGQMEHATFDLVVLSVGQRPRPEMVALAERLGLEATEVGPIPTQPFEKVRCLRPGIFTCGPALALTDIADSLVSASAAAGEVTKLFSALGRTAAAPPRQAPPRDQAREEAAATVVLCRCTQSSALAELEFGPVTAGLERRAGTEKVWIVDGLCKQGGLQAARDILARTTANRVLFGACQSALHKRTLQHLAEEAGFNPGMVKVVDAYRPLAGYLARQVAAPPLAELRSSLSAALAALKEAEPLAVQRLPMTQSALVVGGGVAGMRAALSLAERGVPVHLVEREERLGGFAGRQLFFTLEGHDPQFLVKTLSRRVAEHPRISVHLGASVCENSGTLGSFTTQVQAADGETTYVHHGVTILATGGAPGATAEHGHGQSPRVLNQAELEQRLAGGELDLEHTETVVMVQCVGSREVGKRDYCSRICCAGALKHALLLREAKPDLRVLVLYRDIVTPGQSERYYTEARQSGVFFGQYDLAHPPQVDFFESRPRVRFTDHVLRRPVAVVADLLVVNTGLQPESTNQELARVFGVEVDADGFLREVEPKWRPVDATKEGVFLAGAAHSPQPLEDVIAQAEAAAERAYSYLARTEIVASRAVSTVRDAYCCRCEACVQICPYQARSLHGAEQRIVVDSAACKGCGLCAVSCLNSAADIPGQSGRQVSAALEAILR